MIHVIGVDGRPLSDASLALLKDAPKVAGGRHNLDAVGVDGIELGPIEQLRDLPDGSVVLASGDPGFFGIVRWLRAAGHDVRVEAGASAVSRAFAAIGLNWEDAVVVSAHGRDLRRAVNVCWASPKVAVLTGPGAGPAELGAALAGADRTLHVMTDHGVTSCTPEEAAGRTWPELNTVIVLRPDRDLLYPTIVSGPRPSHEWTAHDNFYAHRAGMITKQEVRAWVLNRLAPVRGDLIWDIGAGSGAVGIDCMRHGAAVIAVERDAESCERIAANAKRHAVDLRVVQGTAPGVLDALPEPDAAFVGGGGLPALKGVIARYVQRIVVTLAAVDRVGPVLDLLAPKYQAGAVMLNASRLRLEYGHPLRLEALNPVFVIDALRERPGP